MAFANFHFDGKFGHRGDARERLFYRTDFAVDVTIDGCRFSGDRFAVVVVVLGLEMKGLCRWTSISGEDDFGCRVGAGFGSLVLAMKELFRLTGVSNEDGFGCRMERDWRLGSSGFWHTQE